MAGKGAVASDYAKTYTSFSGCDIVCTFGNKTIGSLQAISYQIQREKAPIYTMGSAEPRSFSRGKRGIAGSLVFTVFDRDALLASLAKDVTNESTFTRIGDTLNYLPMSVDEWDTKMTEMAMKGVSSIKATAKQNDKIAENIAPKKARPVYDDEIPPFDITISFANEYGQRATIVLYGVELLNEATGFSIDNVTSEKACTFVARRVKYMQPVDRKGNYQSGDDQWYTVDATMPNDQR